MNVILLTDALRDAALTGIGRYVLELARGLPSHPGVADIRFFAGRSWVADPCRPFDIGSCDKTVSRPAILQRIRKILPWRIMQDRISFGIKKVAFGYRARDAASSLLHGPNYLLTPHDGPAVATIHDLSFIHYPEYHPRERLAMLERELPNTLRRAAHILTDTEFVRREIIEILGVPGEKVSVTHLGVDPRFRPMPPDRTRDELREMGLTHGAAKSASTVASVSVRSMPIAAPR